MKNNVWGTRIASANKYYTEWETRFLCNTLEEYWEGFQWKSGVVGYRPYTLNLIYSTIKIKLANIIFQNPQFMISAQPGFSDWDQDFAVKSAQLKQDTLNTIIQNPNSYFVHNSKLCAQDSFFRFCVMEIGFAADWQNPNKMPPVTSADDDPTKNANSARVISDEDIPITERIYFKRIKPSRWRVSTSDDSLLHNCHWCGYYSYIYKNTLVKTTGIKFSTDNLYVDSDYSSWASIYSNPTNPASKDNADMLLALSRGEVCKVWHIWNNHTKERYLIHDPSFEILWTGSFERLPFAEYRHDLRFDGWYPVPPVFQWLSPQDEINETLEQMRNYRRRYTRKFWSPKNTFDSTELDKLSNNEDGAVLLANNANLPDPIKAIANPDAMAIDQQSLSVSKDNLNIVTGTTAPARGESDRTTATESKIIQTKAEIRESVEQIDFTKFLCTAGREALNQLIERFTTGLWIKLSQDPSEDLLSEAQYKAPIFQYITTQNLDDGYDFTVDLNVINATPLQMQLELEKFVQFLSVVHQFPEIAMSPVLIREAAVRCGYRNERVISEMQKAAQLQMLGQVVQGAQNMGTQAQGNPQQANNAAKGKVAQMSPNTPEQISSQMSNQVM